MSDPADPVVDDPSRRPIPDSPRPHAGDKHTRPGDEVSDSVITHRPSRRTRRLPTAARVLLGAGLLGLVILVIMALLGGFAPRTDSHRVDPGVAFSVGPMTLSFDKVVLVTSETTSTWWVTGTCRWDLASSSSVTSGIARAAHLGVRDPYTDEVTINEEPGRIEFDRYPDPTIGDRTALSPDMDPVDCMIRFTMPPDTPLTAERATVVIYDLIWSEARNTTTDNDSSKTWAPGGTAHRVDLPVTVREG